MATSCSVYKTRFPDMFVYLVDDQNRLRGHTLCAGDGTVKELEDLVEKGLLEKGSPCSLRLED